MNDSKYLISTNTFPKFGPIRIKKLRDYFPDSKSIFKASLGELTMAGIEKKISEEFITFRKKIVPDQLLEELHKKNIKVTKIEDDIYPKILKEIHSPPQLIYYKGKLRKEKEDNLSVVGSRKYTNYGQRVIENIIGGLVVNGLNIVSGMALGIDSIAHENCLKTKGRTIAVLGSGIDDESIYPRQNKYLAEKIIASEGALISEFCPGTLPLPHHFPQRNRIVSGLSLGTLVVEAEEKSGSLITARCAVEQNREVFAVPGSIFSPNSKGTNQLIKIGAHPISNSKEIIEALDLSYINSRKKDKVKKVNREAREAPLGDCEARQGELQSKRESPGGESALGQKPITQSEEEEKILSFLSHEETYVDEIIHKTKLDSSLINSTLTIMEMKGIIKNIGGMKYIKNI